MRRLGALLQQVSASECDACARKADFRYDICELINAGAAVLLNSRETQPLAAREPEAEFYEYPLVTMRGENTVVCEILID